MPKYLFIDARFSGTGVREDGDLRDIIEDDYHDPEEVTDDPVLIHDIKEWHKRYEDEFTAGYKRAELLERYDEEGIALSKRLAASLIESYSDYIVGYFSDFLLKRLY